jgi:outer membrane lipoprotein-sorting protein
MNSFSILSKRPVFQIFSLGFLFLVLGSNSHALESLSAQRIMENNEDVRKIDHIESQAIIVTGIESRPQKNKQFNWWRKLSSDSVHFNTLTRFIAPAEIRGEGILFLEHPDSENEVLMYLPNFKKIRRVESQQQSGSFMGSELSYSDISTPHTADYNHRLLERQPCPGSEGSALQCFVIESLPKNDEIRNRTGYSKTVHWIRSDCFMDAQTEFYDLGGGLLKRFVSADLKMVDPVKKKWMALKIRVSNLKSGKFTTLEFSHLKVNQGIADAIFTQQNLSKSDL